MRGRPALISGFTAAPHRILPRCAHFDGDTQRIVPSGSILFLKEHAAAFLRQGGAAATMGSSKRVYHYYRAMRGRQCRFGSRYWVRRDGFSDA